MGKIYIADDNADVRNVVLYALAGEGHDVSVVKDGEQAREAVFNDPPDLLVLDIMMPGLDGYQVLQDMANWGIQGTTRVLVLSARASSADKGRALELGADAFMAKPFDPDELLEVVDDLLARGARVDLGARRDGRDESQAGAESGGDADHFLSELQSLLGDL